MQVTDTRCQNCPNADLEKMIASWSTLIAISLVGYPSVLTLEPYTNILLPIRSVVGLGLIWCCVMIAQWVGLLSRNCALRMYASGYAFALWLGVAGFYIFARVHWLGLMGACVTVGALGIVNRRLYRHRRTVHGRHDPGMADHFS